MGKDWIVELANFFEELRILKVSKQEALKSFSQFCEFVVEPAFENLEDELAQYGIKSKIIKIKNKSIAFQINFRKSKIGHFKYIIEEKEVRFMKEIDPNHILDLDKEEVIQDVIKKYRDFIYESEAVME